jgi:hypothetical protein
MKKQAGRLTLALFVTLAHLCIASGASAQTRLTEQIDGNPHQFDFLIGHWNVFNRRLTSKATESPRWTEFEATDSFHTLPGDLGIEEDYKTEYWPRFRALGLHLYDPTKGEWVLYWADSRNSPGTMQTLARGRFGARKGLFFGKDQAEGKPIDVRVLWEIVDTHRVHWEQALSSDRGKTWTTNWIMEFKRD